MSVTTHLYMPVSALRKGRRECWGEDIPAAARERLQLRVRALYSALCLNPYTTYTNPTYPPLNSIGKNSYLITSPPC